MNQINLPLDKALQMQSKGQITLVDASPNQLPVVDHKYGSLWRDNFQQLLNKAPGVSRDKITRFFNAKYTICIDSQITEGDNQVFVWRYIHGIANSTIKQLTKDTIEYVYVFTNDHYSDTVKIGITRDTVTKRALSVNSSGVIDEWIPVFALPVRKGCSVKVEQSVHKFFDDVRVTSSSGSKREFFKLTPFQAFDKIREVGALFQVGEPLYFNQK